MKRRNVVAGALGSVLALGLGTISGPWGAAAGVTDSSGYHYCAQTPTHVQCYATLAGLQATVPSTAAPGVVGGPTSTSLDTILWSDSNLRGSQLWLENFSCDNTATVALPVSFQKITSSVQVVGCGSVTLRTNPDGSGPSIRLVGTVNVGPTMNDQASAFSYP